MKKILQGTMRFSIFQPLWQKLFYIARARMNYWNSNYLHSGELITFKKIFLNQFKSSECMIDARFFFSDLRNLLHKKFELFLILSKGINAVNQYHERLEFLYCTNIITKNKLTQ